MDLESFARTAPGKLFLKAISAGMESRLRYRFFGPAVILEGAGISPGQTVLEVGCGTGYFTIPAAQMLGESGRLVALDVLPESIEFVRQKVQAAGLSNVRMVKAGALDTGLESGTFDTILIFGVLPAPMLPLAKLLPEMQRLLKDAGTLALWPPIPAWYPQAITQSGLFRLIDRRNGVHNFRPC